MSSAPFCRIPSSSPFSDNTAWISSSFVAQLFANRIAAFFGLDVLVSAVVLLTFVRLEGRRAGIKHIWAPVLATLLVGVSLGLPLFLYLREAKDAA